LEANVTTASTMRTEADGQEPDTAESLLAESGTRIYDAHYYRTYSGDGIRRDALWLGFAAKVADDLTQLIAPASVLDVGCGIGLFVEALRDRGIEAYGLDISPHAIASTREDIREFCWVGTALELPTRRFDLVIMCEVAEHLTPADGASAIRAACRVTDRVLFSSTPDDYADDTHLNVQPPEYWAALFAAEGFIREIDLDVTDTLSRWAVVFRRSSTPLRQAVIGYERVHWRHQREIRSLRERALVTKAAIARLEIERDDARTADPRVVEFETTIAEQQQHLDALRERVDYLTEHRDELRLMLVDAHARIAASDTGLVDDLVWHREAVKTLSEGVQWWTEAAERITAELNAQRDRADGLVAEVVRLRAETARILELEAELNAVRDLTDQQAQALAWTRDALAQEQASAAWWRSIVESTPAAAPSTASPAVPVPPPNPTGLSHVRGLIRRIARRGYRALRRLIAD
jgi:SAM-dependent methyltransferase/uncharacterized coiled-coil protein SlyX